MHAQIVLFDGFDPLDVIAPYEVLTAGGSVTSNALTVELVSAEGPRQVPGGLNIALRATAILNPEQTDLIIVPGAVGSMDDGQGGLTTIPALLAQAMQTNLSVLLKQALDNPSVTVATVCGGSMALAIAGLLQGRHAVTHHMGINNFSAMGVLPIQARVVDDGNLITAGGVTSGLDLALYLLERELGPRVARAVEQLFEYERRGTVWQNKGREAVTI